MIRIEFDNADVRAIISRLVSELEDPTPAFQDIGEYLVVSTKERFQEGIAPDGTPWAPNKDATAARKGYNQPLIGETKRLSNEFHPEASASGVSIGTNLVYAAVQQLGAKKGSLGTSKTGRPLPWGDIPARPFLGVSDTDAENIVAIALEHLEAAAKS